MASWQQKAQQNLEAFEVWKATQTDDDFKQIVFRGQLNRIEVAKGILITHDPQPASRADMASEGLPRLHAP
ncbi:hypothetical protein ACV1DC_22165, partial [Aeromonas caviae]